MNSQDSQRLAIILTQLSLVLHKNLEDKTLSTAGKEINVIDIYEEALDGYDIDRIEEACRRIRQKEIYFPPPATILSYYKDLSLNASLTAIEEPEWTLERLRRSELVKHYWLREFSVEDDKARVKIRAGQSQADLERFVKEHWDDPNIPRVRGKGFERIAKGR